MWDAQDPDPMTCQKCVVLYADHLADRASLLATLRKAVEAMDRAYTYADTNDQEELLLAAIAACREKLEEKV